MQQSRNYYEILGISRQATLEEIKRAYYKLARQFHPDVNSGSGEAGEKFREIARIYEVLSDPTARSHYDQQLDRSPESVESVPPEAPSSDQFNAEELYRRGLKHYRRGKYKQAIAAYSQALQLDPDFVQAYNQRGFIYLQLRDYQAAFGDYNQALQRHPDFAEVYYHRGLTRQQLGYPEAAIDDYTEALRLNPRDAQAYYHRGLARADLDERRGAIADLEKAAQLFANLGDTVRAQTAREAIRSMGGKLGWRQALALVATTPQNTLKTAFAILANPIGQMLPAFSRLGNGRAIAVATLWAMLFDAFFTLGMWELLGRLQAGAMQPPLLQPLVLGAIPFFSLSLASGLVRLVLRGSGTVSGDIFLAGAALVPLSPAVLAGGFLTSWSAGIAVGLFALAYLMLILYSGCHHILRLPEARAALAVPLILVLGMLPYVLIAA